MSTNHTHITNGKKTFIEIKSLIVKTKITEVRQVQIIVFWTTLVLSSIFIPLILFNLFK
ncbi:MAG TPA: hypothetical protein VKG26_05880 [Bacteroidia bacterium]|nr:hypothetical protein [Bacteroidia bacterium]